MGALDTERKSFFGRGGYERDVVQSNYQIHSCSEVGCLLICCADFPAVITQISSQRFDGISF